MTEQHSNTNLGTPASSIIPHLLLWVIQPVALASPPSFMRSAMFSIVIISLAIYCNLHPHFTNDFGLSQPFSIAWSFYIATLAKLLFSGAAGPEAHFWRIDNAAKEGQSYKNFGWKKIGWATELMFNQRGIRWNHQVKNVPRPPHMGRSRFLLSQFFKFLTCACIADFLFETHRRVSFTTQDGRMGEMNSKFLTLRHSSLKWSFLKTFSLGILPYFMLSMQYAQGAFLGVTLHLTQPEDWPSAFGGLQDLKTVRSFWGTFWHQQLRHMLTSYTNAVANSLRIPRGSNVSSYTKLYLAFCISGSFHALGQLHLPRPSNITAAEGSTGFFLFFVWQAVAITVEDFVQWVVRKSGWRVSGKIGYIWVLISMWSSFWLVGDTVLRLRIGTGSFAPFNLTRRIVEAYVSIPPLSES